MARLCFNILEGVSEKKTERVCNSGWIEDLVCLYFVALAEDYKHVVVGSARRCTELECAEEATGSSKPARRDANYS